VTAADSKRPLRSPLSAVAGLAANMARVPTEAVDQLCAAMAISLERRRWRSTLNNDGSPLQICVGLNRAGLSPAIRLIVDPAAGGFDSAEQFRSAEWALGNLLASHGPEMGPLCRSILDRMLPADPVTRAALGSGGAWLAADVRGRGMALYATAKWGDSATRWARVYEWLEFVLPDAGIARETLARLSSHAMPVSVGVEGAAPSDARAKLYWRLNGQVTLDALGIPLFARPEIAGFLACAVGDRRIPIAAIVGSISFHLDGGGVSDVKLDLCAHCVSRPWPDWIAVLHRCSARYGLAEFPFADLGQEPQAETAFVGFGLGSKLTPRLNVYLKQLDRQRSSLQ
jgi:hypothetical protein